jgi:YegS/Rv2252/BmrU family lipid kinase
MASQQPTFSPLPSFKRIHVIANPAAGQDRPFLNVLNKAFQDAHIDWDIFVTKAAGDAERLAREAVESGADVVAAYGGDGTVAEVANGLRGSPVPLAILPGGTANVMSVELGIPGDLPGAVSLICGGGRVRAVDMGRTDDRYFMLRNTIGFTAEMTKNTDREAKNRLGSLAYLISYLREIPNIQPVKFHLTIDGESIDIEGAGCIVANSVNLGVTGMVLAKAVDVSDGLLDVLVVQQSNIGALLELAANAVGLSESLDRNHWQGRDIRVEAEPAQTVECDGEIVDPTPLHVQVVPDAINVVVPKPPENGTT